MLAGGPLRSEEDVRAALPGRPVRFWPALVSTTADALAWARGGGPHGAVVTAGYQAAPRGAGGASVSVGPDDLGFAMVIRPDLPAAREGWLFAVAATAVADTLGPRATIGWPADIHADGVRRGTVAVEVGVQAATLSWAVLTITLWEPPDPAGALGAVTGAIEEALAATTDDVLGRLRPRCHTLGRRVDIRLMTPGPTGDRVGGEAVDVLADGALVVRTDGDRRLAVLPHHVRSVESS